MKKKVRDSFLVTLAALAALSANAAAPDRPTTFTVPVTRQQQIGVAYTPVKSQHLRRSIRAVGVATTDRTKQWSFVARVDGYVQQLAVTSAGELVSKDQPLLTVYSPDLLTSERELIGALNMRDRAGSGESKDAAVSLIQASKKRLAQWNITPKQIEELEQTKTPTEFLTFYSPFNGIIKAVPVEQGQKVSVGDRLVDVADLSVLWIWADVYENEVALIRPGQATSITAAAYPGENFQGRIVLIDPFVNDTMRTARVRIDVSNPDLKLRPGMYLNVELPVDMGEGLTIPVDAVMPTGLRSIVFVKREEGKLEPRKVQLGPKFGDVYRVDAGLKEGEEVVSSANFLIDAESKLQNALDSFETPDPSESSSKTMVAADTTSAANQPSSYDRLIEDYLAIKERLAQDKYEDIASLADRLGHEFESIATKTSSDSDRNQINRLKTSLSALQARNLEEVRIGFGQFSAKLIAWLTDSHPPLSRSLYIIHCTMWTKSPGDWLQTTPEVHNPFLGPAMTSCGETVKELSQSKGV